MLGSGFVAETLVKRIDQRRQPGLAGVARPRRIPSAGEGRGLPRRSVRNPALRARSGLARVHRSWRRHSIVRTGRGLRAIGSMTIHAGGGAQWARTGEANDTGMRPIVARAWEVGNQSATEGASVKKVAASTPGPRSADPRWMAAPSHDDPSRRPAPFTPSETHARRSDNPVHYLAQADLVSSLALAAPE